MLRNKARLPKHPVPTRQISTAVEDSEMQPSTSIPPTSTVEANLHEKANIADGTGDPLRDIRSEREKNLGNRVRIHPGGSPSSSPTSILWLLGGLAVLGFTTGWLIGGSATPVVGAALPLLLGLGVTASQLASDRRRDKLLSALTTATSSEAIHSIREDLRAEYDQFSANAGHIGKSLLAFSLPLLAGVMTGSLARIQQWFVEKPSIPWITPDEPDDVDEFAGTLSLRAKLAAQGFSKEEIQQIVQIHHKIDQKNDASKRSARSSKDNLSDHTHPEQETIPNDMEESETDPSVSIRHDSPPQQPAGKFTPDTDIGPPLNPGPMIAEDKRKQSKEARSAKGPERGPI